MAQVPVRVLCPGYTDTQTSYQPLFHAVTFLGLLIEARVPFFTYKQPWSYTASLTPLPESQSTYLVPGTWQAPKDQPPCLLRPRAGQPVASAWSLLPISLLLLTPKTFTLLGIFFFPLVTFCLLWLQGSSINAMSPRHPLTTFMTSSPALGHVTYCGISSDIWSTKTSSVPREEQPSTENSMFLLCPNANLSLSTSASIHLLTDSPPDHPLSGVHPHHLLWHPVSFLQSEVANSCKISKQQPQATFRSFWQNLPVQLTLTRAPSTPGKVKRMCGNALMWKEAYLLGEEV